MHGTPAAVFESLALRHASQIYRPSADGTANGLVRSGFMDSPTAFHCRLVLGSVIMQIRHPSNTAATLVFLLGVAASAFG